MDINIIGALKKPKSQTSVFFCSYSEDFFNWIDIVKLLQSCRLMQDLEADNIYCVAVESRDEMIADRKIVGITFHKGEAYISLTYKDYSDLLAYFKEITEVL